MKVRTSVLRNLGLLALSSLAFAACDRKDVIVPVIPDPIEVRISPETVVNLQVGQSFTYNAVVLGGDASTNRTVTFSSTSPAVATVNATTGVATAVGPGSTTIIATSTASPSARASAQLVVTGGGPGGTVTISVEPSTASVAIGQTLQLVSIVQGTTNSNVTYTSASQAVATVNGTTGLVTGVSAGTVVITATSVADPTARDVSVITVTPGAPVPPVQITLTPTQATIGIGRTQTFVGLVSGGAAGTSTAVTYTSGTAAVATIDANGVATGHAAGTTVITARSVADPTKFVTGTLTVVSTIAPSVSIQSVTNAAGVQVGVGTSQAGALNVLMNVSAGSETNISRVEVRLGNSEGCRQEFNPPLAPTQGVAQINCVVNTAQLNADGTPRFPNGTYNLTAVAIDAAGAVVATATYGNIALNNVNRVAGTVTFSNVLDDTDNNPDAEQGVDAAGNVWFGGAAIITVTPAIFQGNPIATASVSVDLNCDGAFEATRTVTITGGTGTLTFSEAASLGANTPGIDDVSNGATCFVVSNARDASGAAVTLPPGAGTGNVMTAGTAQNNVVAPGQNVFRIDNVPAVFAGPVTLDAADFDGMTTDAYLGTGVGLRATGSNPNTVNAMPADAGVGVVTLRWIAVPTTTFNTATASGLSQANLAAAAAAGTPFTSADQLASTETGDFYTLVVEATDDVGNVSYAGDASAAGLQFGVDLARPQISIVEANSAPANGINPTTMAIRFQVTDEFSGAEGITGTVIGHSVFEYDADSGVEQRCYNLGGGFRFTITGNNPCTNVTSSTPIATQGAVEFYDVTIPAGENFYVVTIQARDAAGNLSEATLTRNELIDVSAGPDPVNAAGVQTVSIANYTISNEQNTATLNGTVRDNIEVGAFDARFEFAGLMANDGVTDLPDAVPFTQPQTVGTYGLPLTAEQSVTATTQVNVDRIARNAADAAPYVVSSFGFGMRDIASNFAYQGVGVPTGSFNGFPGLNDFTLSENFTTIDRTPGTGESSTTTLTAIATTGVTAANPFQTVYFYFVHPGTNLGSSADDLFVLIGSTGAGSATVLTGESVREFRYTNSLSTAVLPLLPDGQTYRVMAIGVQADGDAVMTEVDLITVNN